MLGRNNIVGNALLPSSTALLDRLISAVAGLRAGEKMSEEGKQQLHFMEVALGALRQREDGSAYAELYRCGRALLATYEHEGETLPPDMSAMAQGADRDVLFGRLLARLSDRVEAAGAERDDFVDATIDWEAALHKLRSPAAPATPIVRKQIDRDALARYLGDRGLTLVEFRRLVGGFQKDTIFVTVDDGGSRRDLVVRAEKSDRFVKLDASCVVDEFAVLQAVHAHGVPSADPLWLEADENALGVRFMVTSRAPGRTPSAALVVADMNEATLQSIVETLADLHAVPAASLEGTCLAHWLRHDDLLSNTLAAVDSWKRQPWTAHMTASPIATRALAWLRRNAPRNEGPPVLLHADYGPHNMVVDGDRVSAVLDWESARLGDPAEDLSYVLMYLGKLVDEAQAIGWYEARSGRIVSRQSIAYFKVYNTVKFIMGAAYAGALLEHQADAALGWSYLTFYTSDVGAVAFQSSLREYRERFGGLPA